MIKTTTDPYVGRLSLVRVFSGTLRAEATVHVSGHFARFQSPDRFQDPGHEAHEHVEHDLDERVGTVSRVLGAQLTPLTAGSAGDVVAVARLTRGRDRRHPVRPRPPQP